MSVLVTGAGGFIGSYLIPALLEQGERVVAFDVPGKPKALESVWNDITYVQGDFADGMDLYRTMAVHGVDNVFHLGSVLAGPCEENPVMGFRVNFQSALNLLDACVALKAKRFVMTSSISVFGRDAPEPVADDAPKNPALIYGQTKLACEHLLLWYARKHGLDTRALRFTWIFGPGRVTGITALYSSAILDAIALGQAMEVSNPDESGDWLYVRDAVKALLTAWRAEGVKQRIYNIAGGVHSIREVVGIAAKYRPEHKITFTEGGTAASPYPDSYDDRVAREELGWRPDYSIEAAVREHLDLVGSKSE